MLSNRHFKRCFEDAPAATRSYRNAHRSPSLLRPEFLECGGSAAAFAITAPAPKRFAHRTQNNFCLGGLPNFRIPIFSFHFSAFSNRQTTELETAFNFHRTKAAHVF